MKEKILKAIDKGLMNVLSTDIEDQDIDFNHADINSEYDQYKYDTVDMGTDVLWCEYNLGAHPGNKASDWYGDYYAWGEIAPKDDYSWETYQYCNGTKDTITKYNEEVHSWYDANVVLTHLEAEDDAVTLTLGNKYRMPTKEEYEKLIKNTTNKWIENYNGIQGLNGRLFTAENGNTLFFPATHYYYGHNLVDDAAGSLWTASVCPIHHGCATYFKLSPNDAWVYRGCERSNGLPVRGVQNLFKK